MNAPIRKENLGNAIPRLVSLDAFRGITIMAMIVVNNPGLGNSVHIYRQLLHSPWNGLTPTDLVFPFFLFIVGVSMVFSFASREACGATRLELLKHVMQRSAIIFGIGLILNLLGADGSGKPMFQFATWRFPGVLQRIALCYFFASLIVLWTGWRGRLAVVGLFLTSYWTLMSFVPVSGFGAGVLTRDGNLAFYLDRIVLGKHRWIGDAYVASEAQGLLSTLPSIGTTLLGVLAGEWLRSAFSPKDKIVWLVATGILSMVVGVLLHPVFPINIALWTSTFVLFTGGCAALMLALFYWLIDVQGWRRWTFPLVVFGMNAIAAYVLAQLGDRLLQFYDYLPNGNVMQLRINLFETVFLPMIGDPYKASLAYALCYMFFCFLVMWVLYRKRIFVKV